jgi:hypothetical protein
MAEALGGPSRLTAFDTTLQQTSRTPFQPLGCAYHDFLVRDDDLGGFGSRQISGSSSSTLPPLEGIGFDAAVLGSVSYVLEKAATGRIIAFVKRRMVAIVRVHQKYSFIHKTANIQERRKIR